MTALPLSARTLLLWLALWWSGLALALEPVPALTARVTDLTGTLSTSEQATLERMLQAFEARKGSQLALLLVPTTQPESIEQYALRVAEQWKLGRKKIDDGALLIIAKNDRALRIEVGYGLEGALNDATCKRIISEIITPRFQQGDFYGGVSAGLERMMKVVDGEPLPPPTGPVNGRPAQRLGDQGSGNGFLVLLLAALFGGGFLRLLFGRFFGALLTGGLVGFLALMVMGSFFLALVAGFLAMVFTLFGGLGRGIYLGGGGGGFGSGGFGGGGFGGGGGTFGGGGASGRW